jgi:hypothetical protein
MTIRKWRWAMLGGGLGIYLLGLGFLGGILTELVQFDRQRTAVLSRYDELVRTWQAYLIRLEQTSAPGYEGRDGPWITHLRRVEDALAQRNVSAADMAWHDAYRAALKSRRWDSMVEVGEAYLRIGEAVRGRKVSEARARELFLTALFRARAQGSLDGVLRTTEAFAALGDREVVEQGLRIAQGLAAQSGDTQALERVRTVAGRLAVRFPGPERAPNSMGTEHTQALLQ